MRKVQAFDARDRLPQLLDHVEQGETVIITRGGRPIARIVPEVGPLREEIALAVDEILSLRSKIGPIPLDELLSARHAGHRY